MGTPIPLPSSLTSVRATLLVVAWAAAMSTPVAALDGSHRSATGAPSPPPSASRQEAAQAAQEIVEGGVQDEPDANGALRVFLDCDRGCDTRYLRQEITYVNYVRDRQDAQVHVLVSMQRTASGGREYTLDFIGLEEFEGQNQRLLHQTSGTDTDDERRRGFARTLTLGLGRYIAQTPLAAQVEVRDLGARERPTAAQPEDDRWNFWVFRAGIHAFISGEAQRDSTSLFGSVSASRVTEASKLSVRVGGSYRESNFEFDDGDTFKNVTRDGGASASAVFSLGEHWGAGVGTSASLSTFRNRDLSFRVAPAIEYNFYPYSESATHQFTLSYFVGASQINYEEITIFDKTSEVLADEGLVASFDVNRPWGEAGAAVQFRHYFHDLSKLRLELDADLEYRIVRGLSLDLNGSVSFVRDQIYLPAEGATPEEILLARRALETDWEYFVSLGISYTFGSIYNNVVNSRLSRRAGGFYEIR